MLSLRPRVLVGNFPVGDDSCLCREFIAFMFLRDYVLLRDYALSLLAL